MNLIATEVLDAECQESHASNILFHEGQRIVVWFGGEREGIWCNIYAQVGDNFPHLLIKCPCWDQQLNSLWNPVLFTWEGRLAMMYKEGAFCDRWQSYLCFLKVKEDKLQLESRQMLPAGIQGSVKNKPLVLDDGSLLCGASTETALSWSCHVERLVLEGGIARVVERSLPIGLSSVRLCKGMIQPALWREGDDLHMLCRGSTRHETLFHSKASLFSPMEWKTARSAKFPNPNSSVDVVVDKESPILIANPSPIYRFPLIVGRFFMQQDDLVMKEYLKIADKESLLSLSDARTREVSYPSAVLHEGRLYVSYTMGRRNIAVATVEI